MPYIPFWNILLWTACALFGSLYVDIIDPDFLQDIPWLGMASVVLQYVAGIVVFGSGVIGFTELALTQNTRGIAFHQAMHAIFVMCLGGFAVSDAGEVLLFTQWQAMILCYAVLAGSATSLFAQIYIAQKHWREHKRRAPRR